ncbi:hypothetical protein C2G38_2179520 [Gigaspora rosea]|uniref:TNFR-Cys domain-containing protein n=1 Tax=Gigaspora rosea TaxID=44941 RepID=A0A397VEZ2_9GLOM|nr:hypothetical protein C2G38_2179520 [Gigaspora rosea]
MLNPIKICYIISLVIALSLFFGLFFGLGYPEIQKAGYYPTACTIKNETIKSRYCCYRECDITTCRNATSSSPSCSSLESRWNAFSPTQCAAVLLANNSQNIDDYCPNYGSQATCDNGYYCCDKCCSTCTSCTPGGSCNTYACNCSCCDSTNHQSCQIRCPECYTVELIMQYPLWGGGIITSNIYMDYDHDVTGAQNFLSVNPVESKVRCYYNPENPLQVLLSVDYSVKTWVLVGISYIFWVSEILTNLFYKISNKEKKSPINMASCNENSIMDDNAPPTYEEAIAKQ